MEYTNMTRSPKRRIAGALTLIAILAVAGCTAASPSPSSGAPSASGRVTPSTSPSAPGFSVAPSVAASTAPSDEPTESLLPFACTPTVAIPATTDRAQITDVRVGTHDGYDRIVFEFSGGIPQTLIEAVLPPFYQDASGLSFEVAGSAHLRIGMNGGTKVTPDGVITYAGPTNFEPAFDQLVQLIEGGDFEAVSTWYLGLNGGGGGCLRVLTLAGPSRLVIDIEH